ncbi:hypothetical protein QE152_g36535 [Popillia japonica]|uniref:Uncharacterized protein n=1 Tax=Popillia japonica TaxID=7064 RepID=A0AAW1ICW1_POPJA
MENFIPSEFTRIQSRPTETESSHYQRSFASPLKAFSAKKEENRIVAAANSKSHSPALEQAMDLPGKKELHAAATERDSPPRNGTLTMIIFAIDPRCDGPLLLPPFRSPRRPIL